MYVRKQVANLCVNIHCFAFKVWECDFCDVNVILFTSRLQVMIHMSSKMNVWGKNKRLNMRHGKNKAV